MSHFTHVLRKLGFFMLLLLSHSSNYAQAIGGGAIFNFLNLPYTAKTTALGGMNISALGNDVGLAMYQPALLDAAMDGQLQLSIKPYLASINQYDLSTVFVSANKKLVFAGGVHYLDYGNITMTDIAGNVLGSLHPNDYMLQWSAATTYKTNFHIGTNIKYIQSNYGLYNASGIAMDVGLNFVPDNALSQASILISNIGVPLKQYGSYEHLPFNIILGFSKKLAYAPLQFSITAQRLSIWNTSYNDIRLSAIEGIAAPSEMKNVLNHLILGASWQIGNQVNIDMGYNFLRRYDLNIQNQTNGLNGLSTGITGKINNTTIQYANSFFQHQLSHHITIAHRVF